jgi:alpha-beta hydrolase superfamily lysophospholipase
MPDSHAEAAPALRRWRRRFVGALLAVGTLAAAIAVSHGFIARQHPDLKPWHTLMPAGEPTAAEMDAGMDLAGYLAREDAVLRDFQARIAAALDPDDDLPGNRFAPSWTGNPARLPVNWNRSFERVPVNARGLALLVHGMTDGPYSLRALAERLAAERWRVLVLRLPGHGTAPSGLLDARWEDWAAAVRLGLRHLRATGGETLPLVAVGYSTGAALLLHHELLALDDPALPRAQRLVLLSPLIGLTRGAGLAPLLSALDQVPGFEKAGWLDVQPEYNPFKYNSFPVNGGWQSHRLVVAVGAALERQRAAGRLSALPQLLTFHSVLDTTVLSDAVLASLYDRLPANGSELVMYDVNRWGMLLPLFKPS